MKGFFSYKRFLFFSVIFCCTVLFSTSHTGVRADNNKLMKPGVGHNPPWNVSTPEEQGLDSSLLLKMLQKIQADNYNIRSIIIIRNHRLVLESYIHPYTRDIPHNTKSASKSMISALTGIALEKKWLDSPGQTISSLLPQCFKDTADAQKKQITLRHLMTMTSGLNIQEQGPDANKIFSSPEPVNTMFQFPMAAKPGEKFNYLTPSMIVMSKILSKTSGKTVKQLADEHLFKPLGINDVQWKKDAAGNDFTDAVLTPIEMAKFGVTILDKGKWQGKQIIPAKWVKESTKLHVKTGEQDLGDYGYWWWAKSEPQMTMALGWGGQGIYIIPGSNMVVVTTGANLGESLQLVHQFIIPSVKSKKPLPPNPKTTAALNKITSQLKKGTTAVKPVKPHPAISKKINGKPYAIPPNNLGLLGMTFHFTEKTCHLSVKHERGIFKRMEVGLDNVYRVSHARPWGEWAIHDKTALKGHWKTDDTFFLDVHPVGRPEQALMTIQFKGEDLNITVELAGTGIKFPLKGKIRK